MPRTLTLFIMLIAAFYPDRAAADEGLEDLSALKNKTASALTSFAGSVAEEGRFELAVKAVDCARILGADRSEQDRRRALISKRQAAFPTPSSPIDVSHTSEQLFKPESLSGWKPSRSKWEAQKKGVLCLSNMTDAFLHRTGGTTLSRYSLSLRFTLQAGGRAGVVLGTTKTGKAGIHFDEQGARFFDFKAMNPAGAEIKARLAPGRAHRVVLVVKDDQVTARINDRHLLSGDIRELKHGRIALYAFGEILFSGSDRSLLELDLLVEKARKALRMNKADEAASCLLRARELDRRDIGVLAMLGDALVRLDYLGEATRCYRDYLDLGEKPKDLFHRSAQDAARRCIREADEAGDAFAAIVDAYAEEMRTLLLSSLAEQRMDGARAALKEIESIGTHPELADALSARIFLAERGGGDAAPLFNGKDLSGWSRVSGEWTVNDEGVIEGTNDLKGRGILKVETLPRFERFLIRTRQRGTGAYIDQGIRLTAGGEPFDFHLYKGMVGHTSLVGRKITVERKDATVLFKGMKDIGLAANQWYDVDFMVDMNLVTLLFDGEVLFTKVLPAPVDPQIALFVEAGRKGCFGALKLMPFGSDESYRAFLETKGLTARCVLECETVKGATGSKARGLAREQPFAYGGFSLANALDGAAEDPLSFRFKSLSMREAILSLRYSAPAGEARVKVMLDGEPLLAELHLIATDGANEFKYCRAPLGDLETGWHTLGLAPSEGGARVILDRLEICASGDAPRDEIKTYTSEIAKHFKIRLSPGMVLPDEVENIFALLEDARGYMVDYYGYEPADPLYFNLISRECWGDPHKGGYASGDNLYVPEDTTFSNIAVIMHEMSHNFDHGNGFNPPWFGEGKSFPCYNQFVDDTKGRYRRYLNPFSRSDKETGEQAFRQLVFNGENLFQFWGTPKFPYWRKTPDGRDLTHLGYKSSNWFCFELSRFLGPTWLRDYFALVRRDIEAKAFFMPRDRVHANSVIVDYFSRSSGKDAAAFFRRYDFHMKNIYAYDAVTVLCGEGDEDYITWSDGAEVVPALDGEGKARHLEEGSLCYTFPVSPDTLDLVVEITGKGRGICEAEGRVLFKGSADSRAGARHYELDDPALFEDARLVLRFSPDKRKGEGLFIEKVVVKRGE